MLAALPAGAQTPSVITGTVAGSDGTPWTGATLTGTLVTTGGSQPRLTPCTSNQNNCPIQQAVPPTTLGPGGVIQGLQLYPNASILPAGSTYTFTVTTQGNPPPIGTGPQSCTISGVTVSGASYTLSFGSCPALSNISPSTAVVNVKTQGAVGNGKFWVDGATNTSNNQVTTSTAVFAASDVNQNIYCVTLPESVSVAIWTPGETTVASFVNSTTLTYAGANAGTTSGDFCSTTNPKDSAAIVAAFNSCKSNFNFFSQDSSAQQPACNIYLPYGIYGLSQVLENLIVTGNEGCVGIIGDGMGKSMIIPQAGFSQGTHQGWLLNDRCGAAYLRDFSIETSSLPVNAAVNAGEIAINGTFAYLENVGVYDQCISAATSYGIYDGGGTNQIFIHPTVISSGGCGGVNGGFQDSGASEGDVYSPFLSNTAQNLQINNAPSGASGAGFRIWGGVIDEGSITSITASIDVWIIGTTLTGGANCLSVDGTSKVNYFGGYCGTFGGNTGGGPTVASGGQLFITGLHVNSVNSGSAAYTSAAYGGIVDDGTNRATTSGGGTVYPSGGFINQTSLSHAQANGFQTGTLATGTVIGFTVDQPISIFSMSWTPSNAFACTGGSFPTISITDGTVTLTTSASDTASNNTVSHAFDLKTDTILNAAGTAGTQIQMKIASTGTCGTPPTNTNVNAWWQATAPVL